MDAFRKIWAHEGARQGLWRGFGVTLMRDVPFAAVYFSTYEAAKHVLGPSASPWALGLHGTPLHLLAGAWAGVVASLVTSPLDGVKTRIQTDRLLLTSQGGTATAAPSAWASASAAARTRARGVLATAAIIFREEGVPGFFRGLGPRLLAVLPSSAVTFAAYEFFKHLLGA